MKKILQTVAMLLFISANSSFAFDIDKVLEGRTIEFYVGKTGQYSVFVKADCSDCSDKFYSLTNGVAIYHQQEAISVPLQTLVNKKYRADINFSKKNVVAINILDGTL